MLFLMDDVCRRTDFNNGCRLRTFVHSGEGSVASGGQEVSAEIACLKFVSDPARLSNQV